MCTYEWYVPAMVGRSDLPVRIDALPREDASELHNSFSLYVHPVRDFVEAIWMAASAKSNAEAAFASALDLAESIASMGEHRRLRHALEVVVTNHPRAIEVGLHVRPFEEPAPPLTWSRNRGES